MAARTPDLFDRSVLVVSGKGGVGKTVVAAACARAAARERRRVALAEVEGRGGVSRLLGLPAYGFEERRTPFGYTVISVTAREALLEYLWLFFHMRTLARSLAKAKVVEVATEAIPGFHDVMVAGKIYELTGWRRARSGANRARTPYDLVVVDAPPTGQLLPQPFPRGVRAAGLRLEAPEVVGLLAEAGAPADEHDAEELLRSVRDFDTRQREERRYVSRLAKAGPVIELPFLFTPSFGPGEVDQLAERFAA